MKKKKHKKGFNISKYIIITLTVLCYLLINNYVIQPQKVRGYDCDIETPVFLKGCNELIIKHIGYVTNYNPDWKIPNWVAYELTDVEVNGTIPRAKHFVPDPEVPEHLSATTNDYRNSGWDRGHMAPAADMKWSETAMKESFYLSNICPQNQKLNGGIWKDLEEHVRQLALEKGSIYVICGPIVSDNHKSIGDNKVAVPDFFFKVLMQNDNGEMYAIAFLFPNKATDNPLMTYALTVDELEDITDMDFFPTLPDKVEKKMESEIDFSLWSIRRPK